jgi:hypothetical protein
MPRLTKRASAALLGTVLALGIPTGFALAESSGHGIEVSAVAKVNAGGPGHGAAVSAVATNKSQGTPAAQPANHGAAVSAVAKDQSLLGGTRNNHGGAVTVVAHKH